MTKQFIIELNFDILFCELFILVAAVHTKMLSLYLPFFFFSQILVLSLISATRLC